MVRKVSIAGVVLWAVLIAPFCRAAELSADVAVRSPKQPVIKGKFYIKGSKIRIDMPGQARVGNGPWKSTGMQTSIIRGDKKVTWLVTPQSKTYLEVRNSEGAPGTMDPEQEIKKLEKSATKKEVGRETVSGYSCRKTRYSFADKTRGAVIVWHSDKLQFPLKTETKTPHGTWVQELSNIKTKVPDSVFEVPKGYKKQTMDDVKKSDLYKALPGKGKKKP